MYHHDTPFCICYAQVALKQWQSSYESYDAAMDLFASHLGEDETPFDMKFSQSSPAGANLKGASSYLGETMSRMIKGIWGGVEDDANADNANNLNTESVREGSTSNEADLSSNQDMSIDNYQVMENMTEFGIGTV